jgi:hypothetical protein
MGAIGKPKREIHVPVIVPTAPEPVPATPAGPSEPPERLKPVPAGA